MEADESVMSQQAELMYMRCSLSWTSYWPTWSYLYSCAAWKINN